MPFARRRVFAVLAALPFFPRLVPADEIAYPHRPIRLVVPNTAGSAGDILARLVAPAVAADIGESLIIEARPGAAGRIAVDHVAASAADGYTLLLANNGTQAIRASSRAAVPFDGGKTLVPVTMLARAPLVVAVNPKSGIESIADLVAAARAQPGRLAFASGGIESTSHLAAFQFMRRSGIVLQHVPYPGTASAVRDVLAGEVPILFTQPATIAALVDSGQLRPLAVTSSHRLPSLSGVPTLDESGYRGFDVSTWYGILVPAGTPARIVARLQQAFVQALATPDVRRQLAALAIDPVGSTSVAFARALQREAGAWSELARMQGDAHDSR